MKAIKRTIKPLIMKYLVFLFITFTSIQMSLAQNERFEKEASKIANSIDSISKVEKKALKKALAQIDKKLKKKDITVEEAEAQKKELAAYHSERINKAVSEQEQKLQTLIKNRVNGTLQLEENGSSFTNSFTKTFDELNYYKDSLTGIKIEKRWTSQFVIALGVNTILNGNDDFYGDGFKTNPIGYGEIGATVKYRLREESNLWNLKFGLMNMMGDITYNNDDDILVTNQGQTTLVDSGTNLRDARLSYFNLGIPVFLELDFSKPQYDKKTEQTYLRSQQGFRLGLGGFAAIRLFTRQYISYKEDGKRITEIQWDDFNTNRFTFGLNAYIGYKDFSLFVKYDINPIFRNNPVDINNLAIGLRVDFN